MNVTARVKCPGCSLHTVVGFKEPKWQKPAIFTFDCSGCYSTVMAKVEAPICKKAKDIGKNMKQFGCKVGVKVIKPSPALLEIIAQEAAFNEEDKPVGDVGSGDEPGGSGKINHFDGTPFTQGEPDSNVQVPSDSLSHADTQTGDLPQAGVSDSASA